MHCEPAQSQVRGCYFLTELYVSLMERMRRVSGGWKDAMFVYKAMKQAGHSMSAPVFDIMTLVKGCRSVVPLVIGSSVFALLCGQVCRNTFGKQRGKLYEALKSAGASYALCFMAANTDGV